MLSRTERGGERAYGWRRGFVHAAAALLALMPGLSVAQPAPAPEDVYILALGDSLTAGFGLPPRQGFVPQLEAHLRRHGIRARVTNAGVSGDTARQGLQRLDWTLDGLAQRPNLVIVALGANDMLRGQPPRETREALDSILTRLQSTTPAPRLLLAGMRAAPNLGPDFASEYDGMFAELAEEHRATLDPFFLEGVAGQRVLNQPDGIHPNVAGVKIMVARMTAGVIVALR